jgi:CHAT domain
MRLRLFGKWMGGWVADILLLRRSQTSADMNDSNRDQQTILFFAANPKDTDRLRVDQEVRDIAEGLQRASHRSWFHLEQRWATRPRDIHRAMLDVAPEIVHFSGQGVGEQGLVFEDETGHSQVIDGAAIAGLFELFADRVKCVILNGCYSEAQAKAIVQHIPFVIGMNQAIGDSAAIAFAVGFYDALGAGRSIEFAHQLGCAAIRMGGTPESSTPVLLQKFLSDKNPTSLSPDSSSKSTPSLKRLQTKLADLEEEAEDLRQKLKWLKKERTLKTDAEAKYELDQRIGEYQKKIQEIEDEMERLEQKINLI